jgi:hypothetical protein
MAALGTFKTVKARFWPWLQGKGPYNVLSNPHFAAAEQIPKSETFERWMVAKTPEEALALAKERFPDQAAGLRVFQVSLSLCLSLSRFLFYVAKVNPHTNPSTYFYIGYSKG